MLSFFTNRRTLIMQILIIFFSICFSRLALADLTLNFGVYASDKPTSMIKKFRPVIRELEKKLSEALGERVLIRIQVANSYQRGLDDLINGKVHFSRLGPASYIEASSRNPNLEILAIESKNGKKEFNGVICVRKDSSITRIEDLKGKRFAFGNQRSTIGRYLAQEILLQHGISSADIGEYEYLDRHDLVAHAVVRGEFDAGALKESTYKKLLNNGLSLKRIATVKNVTKPWVANESLSSNLKTILRNALLSIVDKKTMASLGDDGFLPGSDKDFDAIRHAIKINKNF